MAGADRMTIEHVVRKVLLDQHADVIREAVKAIAAEMMELELSELIGAERGQRRPKGGDASQRVALLHHGERLVAGVQAKRRQTPSTSRCAWVKRHGVQAIDSCQLPAHVARGIEQQGGHGRP